MWSETIGLRTRPVSDQKISLGLGLVGLLLCCYACRHNDLEGHSNFPCKVYSFYCATQICIARTCYGNVSVWLGAG